MLIAQFSAGSGDDEDACTKAPTTLGKMADVADYGMMQL